MLVKGKPRVRMVPEKPAEADKAEQGAVAKEEALGSGTADPAADMFNAKVSPRHTSESFSRYCGEMSVCDATQPAALSSNVH